jgi:DNA-binding NtrC family response regulator
MERKDFKVLVVDDDEITRDMLVSLLAREGYPVVAARDGLEAVHLMRVEDVKLVLTDYKMPGADGIEVLRQAARNIPDVSVVLLTAFGTLDSVLRAMKGGAYDYLTKPFKIQEILIVVERAFKRAALMEENRELARHLRDTYRDIELINTVAGSGNPDVTTRWIERIQKLREANVLSETEAEMLMDRFVRGTAGGS